MRRSALAIGAIPLYAASALAQSQVQQVPMPSPEESGSSAPVPGPTDAAHPSTENAAEPLHITRPEEDPPLPIRPAAPDRDQRTGHLNLALAAAFGNFSGGFLDESGIGGRLGGSPMAIAEIGFGVTRHLELVLAGDYSQALAGADCAACEATSWSVGPTLRYHLVQGTRFSPWVAVGAAYRQNSLVGFSSQTVKSIDFLRLQIGGDWYASSNLAFGPVLGLGLASSISAPRGDGPAIFALTYGGLRLLFELPGR
jgi:hypothetical protein